MCIFFFSFFSQFWHTTHQAFQTTADMRHGRFIAPKVARVTANAVKFTCMLKQLLFHSSIQFDSIQFNLRAFEHPEADHTVQCEALPRTNVRMNVFVKYLPLTVASLPHSLLVSFNVTFHMFADFAERPSLTKQKTITLFSVMYILPLQHCGQHHKGLYRN